MSINRNNETLNEILTMINNLPSADGLSGGTVYTNIVYNDDNTVTLTDKDGVDHTMVCEYTDGVLSGLTYDGKSVELTYEEDALVNIGAIEVDMANVPYESGGGADPYDVINSIINGTITEFYTEETFVNDRSSKSFGKLFNDCPQLTKWAMPNNQHELGGYLFRGCEILAYIDIGRPPSCNPALFYSKALSNASVVIRAETPPTLSGTFSGTTLNANTVFYVPSISLEAYKTATNWSNYADYFKAIEDYPEITGGII